MWLRKKRAPVRLCQQAVECVSKPHVPPLSLQAADVHVVKEEFVQEVSKGGAALLIQSFAISSWGSDPLGRIGPAPSKSGVLVGKSAGERGKGGPGAVMPALF